MSCFKFVFSTLLLVCGSATIGYADHPFAELVWSDVVHQTEAAPVQPAGVSVTVEDGHAIIDFSKRAEAMSSVVSMQFVSPFGPDIEESEDQWEVVMPDDLTACLKVCENIADPTEYEICRDDCYFRFGSPDTDE